MRAKVRLNSILDSGYSKTLKMAPVTGKATPEDAAFWKATPCGSIELQVDNLDAVKDMKVGQFFYVDFTPADEEG